MSLEAERKDQQKCTPVSEKFCSTKLINKSQLKALENGPINSFNLPVSLYSNKDQILIPLNNTSICSEI